MMSLVVVAVFALTAVALCLGPLLDRWRARRDLEWSVLSAVWVLNGEGHGLALQAKLQQVGRRVSLGTLYVILDRLEDRGLLSSREADASAVRGGRPRRYVTITAAGRRALGDSPEAPT